MKIEELTQIESLSSLERQVKTNIEENNSKFELLYQGVSDIISNINLSELEKASNKLIYQQLTDSNILPTINSTNKEVESLLEKIKFFGNDDS